MGNEVGDEAGNDVGDEVGALVAVGNRVRVVERAYGYLNYQ